MTRPRHDGMRRDREWAAIEDGVADAGVGAALERRDEDVVGPDLDDLAAARAGVRSDARRYRRAGRSPTGRAPGSASAILP